MTDIRRHILPDADAVAAAAADDAAAVLRERAAAGARPVLSLTGGSVGVRTAAALAGRDVPWDELVVYFGDERFVPVKDPERNDGQLDEALFDRLEAHPTIWRWPAPTELADDLDEAAGWFAEELEVPADGGPIFDVHLLGMGPEGHVNSLFPHSPAVAETERLVVAVHDCPKPPAQRMTFTLPAVRRSRHVMLVVAGEEKAEAVAAVLGGADELQWPAAGALGLESTTWYLDEAAASRLG